jgi:hypothetical protein
MYSTDNRLKVIAINGRDYDFWLDQPCPVNGIANECDCGRADSLCAGEFLPRVYCVECPDCKEIATEAVFREFHLDGTCRYNTSLAAIPYRESI